MITYYHRKEDYNPSMGEDSTYLEATNNACIDDQVWL